MVNHHGFVLHRPLLSDLVRRALARSLVGEKGRLMDEKDEHPKEENIRKA